MRDKDIVTGNFFRNNQRFADIFNVGMFQGKRMLLGEQLEERDGAIGSVIKKGEEKTAVKKSRDLVKKALYGANFALIGLENQTHVHYAMPVRVLGYDYLRYEEQLREIKGEHQKKKDLKDAEFLSGFSAEDKVHPVFTLVLYYGKEPWTGPKSLSEMTEWKGIPEEIRKEVSDYSLHVLDVRHFGDTEKLETDVRLVFGFLQREADSEELKRYVEQNKGAFEELSEDAYDVISALADTEVLDERRKEFQTGEGGMNMCEALRQLIAEGRAEGKIEGMREGIQEERAEGIKILIEACRELGISKEDMGLKLEGKYSLTKEKADSFIQKFWQSAS